MKCSFIFGLACMSFGLPALAVDSNWVYLSRGDAGIVYLQEESITIDKESGLVEAWTKSEYTKGGHTIDKVRYQCAENQYQLLESHRYNKNGVYLRGGKKTETKWTSVIPESLSVDIVRVICMTAAKQEIDEIELKEGGYTSDDDFTLILDSFGKYADAVVIEKIQESVDSIEW